MIESNASLKWTSSSGPLGLPSMNTIESINIIDREAQPSRANYWHIFAFQPITRKKENFFWSMEASKLTKDQWTERRWSCWWNSFEDFTGNNRKHASFRFFFSFLSIVSRRTFHLPEISRIIVHSDIRKIINMRPQRRYRAENRLSLVSNKRWIANKKENNWLIERHFYLTVRRQHCFSPDILIIFFFFLLWCACLLNKTMKNKATGLILFSCHFSRLERTSFSFSSLSSSSDRFIY